MFVVEVATFARAISFGNFNDGKYRRFSQNRRIIEVNGRLP